MDQLLAKCIAGDEAAWAQFVAGHCATIRGAARDILRRLNLRHDATDIDDVVSETLLALCRDDRRLLRDYDPALPLARWIATIARARCIDLFRRKRPGRHARLDPQAIAAEPAAEPDAEEALLVRRAMDDMPDRDRLLLKLFYFEHLKYREIAAATGMSMSAVAVELYRAKARFADKLKLLGMTVT